MDETPFYRRPIFWVVFWIFILVGLYGYQILTQATFSSILAVIFGAALLAGLFTFWTGFYAQFILPVRTLDDRSKIIQRLRRYVSRTHGPAIFIQNGRIVAREGELDRRQAGVIWLDSASAAVTRTMTAYHQVIGPGVHFTEDGEYLAGWLDLHAQVQSLGPREGDLPFHKLPEDADEAAKAKYREVQERRSAVSALTRDGIEVIPNLTVVFKVDAQPADDSGPGSRFGFDENAVFKAISKEGINPNAPDEARHVAWNQIPALIAADLWREFAAKFTLSQLFEPSQPALPEIPQPQQPDLIEGLRPLPRPHAGFFARLLRAINRSIEKRLEEAEGGKKVEVRAAAEPAGPAPKDSRPKTALQIITQMIKARMTQGLVPILDESGRLLDGQGVSEEYKKLQERGLKVVSVSIGGLRLPPAIEERSIKEWNANWLVNAQAERERIERRTAFVAEDGKQTALLDYAGDLSKSLVKERPRNLEAALLALLERSRNEIIRDDRLRRRINTDAAKTKDQADIAPALLALLERSRKEPTITVEGAQSRPNPNVDLETLEHIIKRVETNDL
jgi:23S rRNA pseudoU1915 N3-methylase RlmH